jgi:hypothetical protein
LATSSFYRNLKLRLVKEENMFNLYVAEKMAEIYRAEQMEEAEIAQLLKEMRDDRPSVSDRFLLKSGDLLISLGQRLKGQREVNHFHSFDQPCTQGAACEGGIQAGNVSSPDR